MTGNLPISTALSEARADSLSEIMSRDPESYQQQDLDIIITANRAQRQRWADAEASGQKIRQPKAEKGVPGTGRSDLSMEDLGL